MSLVETVVKTLAGVGVAWLITVYLLDRMLGIEPVAADVAFGVTLVYTISSIIRSYVIRRLFVGRG